MDSKIEIKRVLDRMENKIEDMEKEVQNNQRPDELKQLQAQQPRLAVKAGAFQDKKTRESKEGFAADGILAGISSDRVHNDLMRLTSFGFQEHTEPSALTLYELVMLWLTEAPKCKSRVSQTWRRASQHLPVAHCTPAQLLLTKHKGPTFPPQLLGASERRSKRRILLERQQDRYSPSLTVLGTLR